MNHCVSPPTDDSKPPRRGDVDQLWSGCHAALKARDMQGVVAFLHLLATRDPHGVELFLAALDMAVAE